MKIFWSIVLLDILKLVFCQEASGGDDGIQCSLVILGYAVAGSFIAGIITGIIATLLVISCSWKALKKKQSRLVLKVNTGRSQSVSDDLLSVRYHKKVKNYDGGSSTATLHKDWDESQAVISDAKNSSATLPSNRSVVQQKPKMRRSFSLDQTEFDIPDLDAVIKQSADGKIDESEHYYEYEAKQVKKTDTSASGKNTTSKQDRKVDYETPKYCNVGLGGKSKLSEVKSTTHQSLQSVNSTPKEGSHYMNFGRKKEDTSKDIYL